MNPESLFSMALGITPPWEVEGIEFSKEAKRLDIKIGFQRGATFACPVCGAPAPAYDTSEKTWRHLNFFQYEAYLTVNGKVKVYQFRELKNVPPAGLEKRVSQVARVVSHLLSGRVVLRRHDPADESYAPLY